MGNHSKHFTKNMGQKIQGYRIIQHSDFVEIIPNRWNQSWTRLAHRLQTLGVLLSLRESPHKPTLLVSIDGDEVLAILSGRRIKRRIPNVAAFGLALPALLMLGTIPLGSKPMVTSAVVPARSEVNKCAPETITKWLEGSGESLNVTPLSTSFLGGVTVGTLECQGSRYSYTLRSEDPKRVLRLQRLNT